MQIIERNQGQVTQHGDIHVHVVRAPPDGHPSQRDCPQCSGATWRMTQWCVHCGADLFALDLQERQRRNALRSLTICGVFMLLSIAAMWGQNYLPPGWRLWASGISVLSMLVAVAALKS